MIVIKWKNKKVYSRAQMISRKKYIYDCLKLQLPLVNDILHQINIFADRYNIDTEDIISQRNNYQIVFEIESNNFMLRHKNDETFVNMINHKYKKLKYLAHDKNLTQKDIEDITQSFFLEFNLPFTKILEFIDYQKDTNLDDRVKTCINKLFQIKSEYLDYSKKKAMDYESLLENFLTKNNIKYKTESQLRQENFLITPDILLLEPILIEVNGTRHKIHWMDAKCFTLNDSFFLLKKMKQQSKKYNQEFGMGAFVFKYGFCNCINIDSTLILDGSSLVC